jgi:hypothetical protein
MSIWQLRAPSTRLTLMHVVSRDKDSLLNGQVAITSTQATHRNLLFHPEDLKDKHLVLHPTLQCSIISLTIMLPVQSQIPSIKSLPCKSKQVQVRTLLVALLELTNQLIPTQLRTPTHLLHQGLTEDKATTMAAVPTLSVDKFPSNNFLSSLNSLPEVDLVLE